MMDQAKKILQDTFGFPSFKPFQQEVIEGVLHRRDTVVVLPTGGGKSLCYIIPAMIFKGITIVVSPLISLMEDQVGQLTQTGIPAVCLNSMLTQEAYTQNIRLLRANKVKLLYLAPETLMMPRTLELLGTLSIDLLAVDEAHCVSEWGHDFRPEYRQVQGFRTKIPGAVVMALTATATPQVRTDILTLFQIPPENFFMGSFNRDNLFLDVQIKNNPQAQLLNFIKKFPKESGIVYCTTRKSVNNLCDVLTRNGFSAAPYHAGLEDEQRRQNQIGFIRDDIQIMVATIAFGMGIDKPDVRFIVQYDLPKNIETYYQQIGRAGRDGLRSDCLLLYAQSDTQTITRFIRQKEADIQAVEQEKLDDMLIFARGDVSDAEYVSTETFCQQLKNILTLDYASQKISFQIGRELSDVTIKANLDVLLSAVQNIIDNAIEAGDAETNNISIKAGLNNENKFELSITDNGCGMSQQTIDRVLEPFFTTRTNGTGLGLAVVNATVNRFNGEMSIASTAGEGSVFTLQFPRAETNALLHSNLSGADHHLMLTDA
ncbi:MAG: RecQ family ATP-dependent DNA helicase, partial [Desulfobacterium sp.]